MSRSPDVHWLTRHRDQVPIDNDWLTPRERAVLAGLRVIKRRSDWRLGRWTAKCLLRARLEERLRVGELSHVEVVAAPDGSPVARADGATLPVTISISHSNAVAMCALAEGDVALGCDAELIEERSIAFVRDFFSQDEVDIVTRAESVDRPLLATLMWSAKESVLKARREGLRRDTQSVVVDIGDDAARRDPNQWSCFTASCTDDPSVYSGWWMVRDRFVYTLARERVAQRPYAGSDRVRCVSVA